MDGQQYLKILSQHLVQEITPTHELKKVTKNPDQLGRYSEEAVRTMVRRMIHPLNVATGGIVYEENYASMIPQIDTIFWSACPVPPIFSAGSFAMIPRHSAFGYLEIKRSAYPKVGQLIGKTLSYAKELIPYPYQEKPLARGVICLREFTQKNKALDKLVDEGMAFVLIDLKKDGSLQANPKAVWDLVNFVAEVKQVAMAYLGNVRITHQ
jgi:hypothetical protein